MSSLPSTKPSLFHRWKMDAVLTALPAALIALVCCAMPLVWMVVAVMLNPQVRREIVISQFRLSLLERTLGFNALAAIIATLMGIPAALVLGRGRPWLSRIMWVLLPSALLMPSLSYAYGWSQVVRVLQDHVYDFSMPAAGKLDVFRCIWSLAAWLWAVPAGLIGLALRRMDTSVQQQALLEGALYRITLRQLLGPIIASLAVVTVLASQEFAVYEPTGISVVATEVRMVFVTGSLSSPDNSIIGTVTQPQDVKSPDQAARAAASVVTTMPLLGCVGLLAIISIWGVKHSSAADAVTVGRWPRCLDAPRWAEVTTIALLMLTVGVPVLTLVGSLHIRFSLLNMLRTFGPEVLGAILVGGITAVFLAVAAFSCAGKWTRSLMFWAGTSFLIGGQLLAIALIRIYDRELFPHFTDWLASIFHHPRIVKAPFDLSHWMYNAWPVPVIAYAGRFGWLAMAAGRSTWTASWKELRDMASLDGAGTFRTAWSVVWPLAWPILVAGALLVGALSLTEVPATVILFPMNPPVLTPRLMTWLHQRRSDDMINASLLMMMMVLLPAFAGVLLAGVGFRVSSIRLKKNEQ